MVSDVVAVDLFCGAGGLSCGLKQAGVDVVAGIDVDPACQWPYEHNIGACFVRESVREITGEDIVRLWGRRAGRRLLAGCAPCQPFSSQRRGADSKSHESWDLLLEFARLVDESRPGGSWRDWPDDHDPVPQLRLGPFRASRADAHDHPARSRPVAGIPRELPVLSPGEPAYFAILGRMIGNAVPLP